MILKKRNIVVFSEETFMLLGTEKTLVRCGCSETIFTASSIEMLINLIESDKQIDDVIFHLKRVNIIQFYNIYEALIKCAPRLILLVEPMNSHFILILLSVGVRYIISLSDRTTELICLIKNNTSKYFFGSSILGQLNILKCDVSSSNDLLNHVSITPVTQMEKKVFIKLISGLSAKEVGAELRISVKTVSVHKTAFLRKIGLRNINLLYKRNFFL